MSVNASTYSKFTDSQTKDQIFGLEYILGVPDLLPKTQMSVQSLAADGSLEFRVHVSGVLSYKSATDFTLQI